MPLGQTASPGIRFKLVRDNYFSRGNGYSDHVIQAFEPHASALNFLVQPFCFRTPGNVSDGSDLQERIAMIVVPNLTNKTKLAVGQVEQIL